MIQETLTAEEIDSIIKGELVISDNKLVRKELVEKVIDINVEEEPKKRTTSTRRRVSKKGE